MVGTGNRRLFILFDGFAGILIIFIVQCDTLFYTAKTGRYIRRIGAATGTFPVFGRENRLELSDRQIDLSRSFIGNALLFQFLDFFFLLFVVFIHQADDIQIRFCAGKSNSKHLTFHNLTDVDEHGRPTEVTQDMKNTYLSLPVDLKFSAERWNNYRPYIMAGINPMLNLTSKNQEYIQLKKSDLMLEVGLGCDFYLPFFKLIPELKFCYSLRDALDHDHANELKDENMRAYTNAVTSGHSKMIVLTLYFE